MNRTETVRKITDNSHMFLVGKNPRNSPFFLLCSYTRAKSWKYVFISTSNGYNSKKKEREFFVHIF